MPEPTESTAMEHLIRLEGKIDAYAAGQSARLDAIESDLKRHDAAIENLRQGTRSGWSGWQIAGVLIAGLAVLATMLGVGISLIQALAGAGG